MSLFVAQLLLLCGAVALVSAPVAFVVFGYKYATRRRARRAFLVTSLFIAGALTGALIAWRFVPSQWTLSFWTTLKATVDSKTYGRGVEHYAEGVVLLITAAGLLAGVVSGVVTAFFSKRPAID